MIDPVALAQALIRCPSVTPEDAGAKEVLADALARLGFQVTRLRFGRVENLFARLGDRGFRTAVAGMTLPNPASEGLHRAVGFEPVGTYRRIGWKHGAWHDVAWMQRIISGGEGPPPEPA